MKFFTRAWIQGELDDATADRIPELYSEHLDGILEGLPVAVRELATARSLHDGLIRAVVIDHRNAKLVLCLRCGDHDVGYFDVDLEYRDTEILPELVATLRELTREPDVELLYDEFDLMDGSMVLHRLLFAPVGEIELRFSQLEIRVNPRADRELKREGLVEITA